MSSANDINGNVRVLHVIERPQQLPLEAPPTADEDAKLDRLQDRAERIAERYKVHCVFVVEYARSVAETVVAEAVESKARVLFVGLRERRRPGVALLLSGTIRHMRPARSRCAIFPPACPNSSRWKNLSVERLCRACRELEQSLRPRERSRGPGALSGVSVAVTCWRDIWSWPSRPFRFAA